MVEKDIKEELYDILKNQLASDLSYHGIHHTIDVHNVCKSYIEHFNIGPKSAALLEIAAVGHDIGFVDTYANHEEFGARRVLEMMVNRGYPEKDIEIVFNLIMATKIPQQPSSFLEQIICDADLDYLGRHDFTAISKTLKEEWRTYNIVPDIDKEYDRIQIGFLTNHFYHTDYAIEHRGIVKEENLRLLEENQKKKVSLASVTRL